ncbi:5678_t:CDS:1, partial [Paraglomus brasilianum]
IISSPRPTVAAIETSLKKKAQDDYKMPDKEQVEKAKYILEDPDGLFYHFAVAGVTGTGKSSLINALRGCEDNNASAARVGIVETTMDIKRYPDRSSLFKKFVWYDVPGAGTQANRGWQYFNDNGLFVFDFIIICWKDRISETDMQILDQCEKFEIPTFLVRTNSETHIRNLKRDCKITEEEAIKKLIKDTCESVKKNLEAGNYNDPNKKVYIVDRYVLGEIVSTKMHYSNITEDDLRETVDSVEGIIDECNLLMDLLNTAKGEAKTEELKKELKKAQDAWFQGIPPDKIPDEEQVKKAKSMLKDPNGLFYHFAVAGYT